MHFKDEYCVYAMLGDMCNWYRSWNRRHEEYVLVVRAVTCCLFTYGLAVRKVNNVNNTFIVPWDN